MRFIRGYFAVVLCVCLALFAHSQSATADSCSRSNSKLSLGIKLKLDGEGDCEDSAILLATMLRQAGMEVALIVFDDHAGVGIAGDFDGSYVEYNKKRYYFIESTNKDPSIGDLFKNYKVADVFPVR